MLDHKTLAFVGSGIMAEAMIKGLLRQGFVVPEQIVASGPRLERGEKLTERYGVRVTTDNVEASWPATSLPGRWCFLSLPGPGWTPSRRR